MLYTYPTHTCVYIYIYRRCIFFALFCPTYICMYVCYVMLCYVMYVCYVCYVCMYVM